MTNDGMKYGVHAGRVASGLIVLTLGALMLIERHNAWRFDAMQFFPGMVLVLIGVVRLLWGDNQCRRGGASRGGFWLVFVGVWLIGSQSHLFGMTFRNSWPLLIVGWGVLIVVRELFGRDEGAIMDPTVPSERR